MNGVVLTTPASGIDGLVAWVAAEPVCTYPEESWDAVLDVTRSMAAQLGPLGIRVNRSSTPYLPNTPAVVRRWHQKNVSAAG